MLGANPLVVADGQQLAKAFDTGLRQFWNAHRFQRASWTDLQRAFETASGEKLDSFFQQWVERAQKAEAGTGTGSAGTSVATETWGQGSPLKFRRTHCEY